MSDSDFEYITDATDASSEGEFSSDMNENLKSHDNQILILLALSASKKCPKPRPNNAKKLRKVNTVNYAGDQLNFLSPQEDIYLMDSQV